MKIFVCRTSGFLKDIGYVREGEELVPSNCFGVLVHIELVKGRHYFFKREERFFFFLSSGDIGVS